MDLFDLNNEKMTPKSQGQHLEPNTKPCNTTLLTVNNKLRDNQHKSLKGDSHKARRTKLRNQNYGTDTNNNTLNLPTARYVKRALLGFTNAHELSVCNCTFCKILLPQITIQRYESLIVVFDYGNFKCTQLFHPHYGLYMRN